MGIRRPKNWDGCDGPIRFLLQSTKRMAMNGDSEWLILGNNIVNNGDYSNNHDNNGDE
jgi:hypothetical protein